jgi:hypothetical protein
LYRDEEIKENRKSYLGEGLNYENDKNSFKKKEQASREIIAEISKKLKV